MVTIYMLNNNVQSTKQLNWSTSWQQLLDERCIVSLFEGFQDMSWPFVQFILSYVSNK